MKVKIMHAGKVLTFDDPQLVLVEKSDGTPLAVAAETGVPGVVVVSSVDDDKRFNQVLQQLGIDRTVFVEHLDLKSDPVIL